MKKALLLFLLPMLSLAAWAQQSSPYTGVAVGDIELGNDYYIYNVESSLWLQNNNTKTFDWTTRAAIGMYGLDWTIARSPWDASGYAIGAKFGKPSIWADDNYIDWHDDGSTWMITPISVSGVSNACKITCGNITMGTVRYAEGESRRSTNILTETTNDRWYLENPDWNRNKDDDANYQQRAVWQLVTKAERLQYLMDNASESNPLDATWLIGDPDFSANNQREGLWHLDNVGEGGNSPFIGNEDNDEGRGVRAKELWRPAGDNTFDFYQVLNGVPDGKYRFTLQGFTRHGDGSLSDADEHTVYYYAGSVSHKMKSIFADARDASSGNFVDNIDGKFIPNSTGRASRAINSENAYVNEEIEVTVAGGTLRIGVKREASDASRAKADWTVIDNFKLTYLGPVADLGPYIEGLANALAAAEAYNGMTTGALQDALDAAYATAYDAQGSEDIDVLSNAARDLNNALEAAQAVDVSVLSPSVAFAKAKGMDVSAWEDYLENGTTADVESRLNAVVLALKQHMAERSTQPTIFTMISESVVGTDDNTPAPYVNNHVDGFYVYNVGTGRWFCGGDEWGAHAAVGFPGIKITTPEDNWENGHYNGVVTWLFNGNWGDNGKLNNGGYCDTGGNAWKFWRMNAEQGIYTWSNNGNNQGINESNGCGTRDLVGFTPSTYARVDVHQAGADNPYNQWIFVTEAQRDAMAAAAMASASVANPVDLTYKIKMPGFNQRERKEGTNQDSEQLDWTCNHANYRYANGRHIICERGENHADFVCDIYGGDWNDAFSLTQTISGLMPGRYRVKVQGYNGGGDEAGKACLVANGQKATLVERESESVLPWTSRLPETTFENPEYFQVGLYWNEVLCTVGADGTLTLGVESPMVTGSHVIIFDNFRLEYVGQAVTVGEALYATYVAPVDVDFTGAEVSAFAAQEEKTWIHLEPVTTVPAGTAVVVKATAAGTYAISSTTGASLAADNILQASNGIVADGTQYVLAQLDETVGFAVAKSGSTIPAGKGYLVLSAPVKAFYPFSEDEATGISPLLTSPKEEGQVYNLSGQRLSKMQKGINIVSGKKMLK